MPTFGGIGTIGILFAPVPARHARRACEGVAGRAQWIEHMYYTYVLRSSKDNKLYIGYTDNLKRRIEEHMEGQVTSTKTRLPVELVYYEACQNSEKAVEREKYFKTGFGRRFLKSRI